MTRHLQKTSIAGSHWRSGLVGLGLIALVPGGALGQDDYICDRGDGVFYGHPVTIEQIFEIPGPAGLAAMASAVFPDPGDFYSSNSAEVDCGGGGLVGAMDCVAAKIAGAGDGSVSGGEVAAPLSDIETAAQRAAGALSADPQTDPALAAAPGDPTAPPRVIRQVIVMRPVLTPGAPGQLRLEPFGPAALFAPEGLSEAEIAELAPRISAQNAALLEFAVPFDSEAQEAVIDGIPRPVPLPPLVPGLRRGDPAPTLAMGRECNALFRAMSESARLLGLWAEKKARIDTLQKWLKDEQAKAGMLGLIWDSDRADHLERVLAEEMRRLGLIDRAIGEQQSIIDRRQRVMTEDERRREIEAIKADPGRMAEETQLRRDALIASAQDTAAARWHLIEGEAAYAREIAAREAMITAARERGEDALADALDVDKSRLETARDSWRQHAEAMIDTRTREQLNLIDQNRSDGIGPVTDATLMLMAEGINPVEHLEAGARERALAAATRRVAIDAETLGGTATQTYGLMDFGQDLHETNLEMSRDPALFFNRYGSYMKGVGQAAYDGVVDIAKIGVEAGDLAGEAFESGLSSATGYEFNAFGRENLDAVVAAGTAISRIDALKIGELAASAVAVADRRISRMASGGEAGLREALETTGYIAGTVLGAETLAVAGAMRGAAMASDVVRAVDNVADVARGAGAAADAARVARTATDVATDAARVADRAGDTARAADRALEATADASRAVSPTPDPATAPTVLTPDPATAPTVLTPDPATAPTVPTPDPATAPTVLTPDPAPLCPGRLG